jgi:hypothetical protein
MSAPAIPQADLHERVISAVREARAPVTVKNLARVLKVKKAGDADLSQAIESAVDGRQIYRWPDRGRSQYFWNVAPEEAAREAIVTTAAAQALSKIALSRLAAKKLPGFPAKRMESIVSTLLADHQLHAVPGLAGRTKVLLRPGDQLAYFNAVRSFVEERIRAAGFDPAVFFKENSSPEGELRSGHPDAAKLILEAVHSLEPVRGVPVSTLRLRNHLPNLTKREFDAAALELRKKQQVFLSQHADPYNLAQDDKNLLIDGQDGTYYVAIAIR